jgi:hypothetical protein
LVSSTTTTRNKGT